MGRYASSVFRLSAWLKEDVAPELLQCALNRVMPRFPFFCVLIKKGLFWHYADAYNGRCEVRQETGYTVQADPSVRTQICSFPRDLQRKEDRS